VPFRRVDITKTPPTVELLRELCDAMGVSPREILRMKDPAYAELGLDSGRHDDEELLELMSKHPGLIQRPIVVRGRRAVLARPVERIETLLS
jgi:arsenate reductase